MKAGIVMAAGQVPTFGDFEEPQAGAGEELIQVSAAALSHLSKGRASGTHYSASGQYPLIPGVDGVGKLGDGTRVYFALPRAPFGSMAERTIAKSALTIPLPLGLDDVEAAGIANPGMSCWLALKERAKLEAGETVLINGATGTAGKLAIQVAKHLGAKKVIATGRNPESLKSLQALGADFVIPLAQDEASLDRILEEQFKLGVHVVLDYLWGPSAERILSSAARADNEKINHRFVHVGGSSSDKITLPGAILRAIALEILGSGLGSVPSDKLIHGISELFQAAVSAGFQITLNRLPLSRIADVWGSDTGNPRTVFTI
jgi:NADPH:quinone reductase-like Zn-dependent oxidoreductase